MKLYIVRHGQSVANELKQTQGEKNEFKDTPLTEKGQNQASQIAERLKNEEFDFIYSSPLKRARQTCEAINKYHKKEIIFDERLREKEVHERISEFINRTIEIFEEIKKRNGNILIVAHGGVNINFCALTKKTFEEGGVFVKKNFLNQFNTCLNIIESEGEHYKIRLFGCINHYVDSEYLVHKFKLAQKIPYKICDYNEDEINEDIKYGDCRHKSELLKQFLSKKNIESKKFKVLFDWKDLPIPKEILNILISGTKFYHTALKVKISDEWIYVDPTWGYDMTQKGFPVTKDWDGLGDSKQVTAGELEFFDEEVDKSLVNTNKEELDSFIEKFNEWISSGILEAKGFVNKHEAIDIAKDLHEWFTDKAITEIHIDFTKFVLLVYYKNYKAKGFLNYYIKDNNIIIKWMGVEKESWNKGYGKKLLEYLEYLAKEQGAKKVIVETLTETDDYEPYIRTREFYKKNGFVKVGLKKAEKEGWDDMDIMEKEI